jgi:glucoamylase
MVPVIPDPEHPEYTVYWLRDGCRVYHTWLNELAVPGPQDDTKLLRSLVDDSVHALIRTQQAVSLAGNVFTGGLEEAVFDVHLRKVINPISRPGSPAAGKILTFRLSFKRPNRNFSQMGRLFVR